MLREADTRSFMKRIRKLQETFFSHMMRIEKVEHLATTGMIEGKFSKGKQREKKLDGLTMWLKVGRKSDSTESDKGYKDAWTVMISCLYSSLRSKDTVGLLLVSFLPSVPSCAYIGSS